MPEPNTFFDQGVKFECTQCGLCCTGEAGQVLVNQQEIEQIKRVTGWLSEEFLRDVPDGKSLIERDNGDCIFFEERRCLIHSIKPTQCRTYPFWVRNLRSEAAWQKASEDCEGIGRGKQYSKEEILTILGEEIERLDAE